MSLNALPVVETPPHHHIRDHRTWTRMTPPDPASDLIEKGYTFIDFNPQPGLIDQVIEGFTQFRKSRTLAQAKEWTFGPVEDPDLGFISKTDASGKPLKSSFSNNGDSYDDKSYFHYRPQLLDRLDEKGVYYREETDWLEKLDELAQFCFSQAIKAYTLLDLDLEGRCGIGHVPRIKNVIGKTDHTIRLIHYERKMEPGALLGAGHFDRNSSTFQVYESHSALWVVDRHKQNVPYHPTAGKVLWFPGEKSPATTSGVLTPTWHYVEVPKNYQPTGKMECRDSIVYFMHEYERGMDRLREYGDGTKTAAELQTFRDRKKAEREARKLTVQA